MTSEAVLRAAECEPALREEFSAATERLYVSPFSMLCAFPATSVQAFSVYRWRASIDLSLPPSYVCSNSSIKGCSISGPVCLALSELDALRQTGYCAVVVSAPPGEYKADDTRYNGRQRISRPSLWCSPSRVTPPNSPDKASDIRASANVLDLVGSGFGKGAIGVTYRRDLDAMPVRVLHLCRHTPWF